MIRLMKMQGKWYGTDCDLDDEEEVENVISFVEQSNVVVLVDTAEQAQDFVNQIEECFVEDYEIVWV